MRFKIVLRNELKITYNDVKFSLERGQIVAIVGESGGGKSMLCQLIVCDQIYILENGTFSHVGTHEQLMASQNMYSEYFEN